jgi:hypothetical protein
MSKGSPKVRIPKPYDAAIRLEARNAGLRISDQLRIILRDHFKTVYEGYTQTSGVPNLVALTRLAKQYMTTVELARQAHKTPMKDEKAAGLPGAPKRDELEVIVWKAIQEAVSYSKTEDAAKDALARLLALRVANSLMRTELAILKHQDDAFVDELIKELRQGTDELEKETRKGSK